MWIEQLLHEKARRLKAKPLSKSSVHMVAIEPISIGAYFLTQSYVGL